MKIKRIKLFIPLIILSLLFLANFAPKSYGISEKNAINKIEARYRNVYSISAYFYQKEIIPGYSQNMAFKGNFYYERNAGMAWVYEYPFHKRQVLKNGRLYIVNSKLNRVSVINVERERGGFPPNVIKAIGSLTKYFDVENVTVNRNINLITVELKPLKMQRAKKIYVGFDKNSLKIKSLKIITHQEQIIIFKYKNVQFNGHIAGNIFNIHFPAYYKIIKEN